MDPIAATVAHRVSNVTHLRDVFSALMALIQNNLNAGNAGKDVIHAKAIHYALNAGIGFIQKIVYAPTALLLA